MEYTDMRWIITRLSSFEDTPFGKFLIKNIWKPLKEYIGWDDILAFLLMLVGLLYYWDNSFLPYHQKLFEIYSNIHTDLIGIGITVLIITNADQYIQTRMEKRKLILQLGSPDHGFAIEAARQLYKRGWHEDGTIRTAELTGANLKGVYLSNVDLGISDLDKVNLSGANLISADLHRANMYRIDLSRANLNGANMYSAYLKDANLADADLLGADLRKADLNGASLKGAHYNKITEWPDGFDAEAVGAIFTNRFWSKM